MTADHLREIALIQISQAQRTPAMTIIDTTLYAGGALRLSRHGAGRGGDVLVNAKTGEQLNIHPEASHGVIDTLDWYSDSNIDPDVIWQHITGYHADYIKAISS